ncbi:MAG: uroporphyrinogen decarboxylase family protein [Chloroflexota bacterium]|nr:MAG: uroporphyrinogen decarboxylase family protein [Chloroflexota bacterium]
MSEVYTGKQRVSAAFKKTFTDKDPELDRVPAYIFTGACNAKLIGASVSDLLQDHNVFLKAQTAAYERYKPDIMIMMWDLSMDIEAMGNELRYPEDSMSVVTKEFLADKGKLSSVQVPDPKADGRLPGYLEACAALKEVVTEAPVSGVIAGPWTIAMGLRGANDLIVDTKMDPDFVHELMQISTEATKSFTQALSEIGIGVGYSEAPASCNLISPAIYRDFVLPYHKELVSYFKEKKIGVGIHICGNANPILEDMVSTGASNISVDSGTDLAKAAEAARGKSVLIGNVPTECFLAESKDVMKQAIEDCLAKAANDSGYILAPGCEVPTVAPPEKIDWFMELANEVGSYQ